MNFLDAHRILNAYIDVTAKKATSRVKMRKLSELKNTKEDVFAAYKIFIAHMFVFHTRTQEEYETIDMLIGMLNIFIDDEIVNELDECQRIVEEKSFLGRIKKKAEIQAAEARRAELLKKVAPALSGMYCSEERDRFTTELVEEVKRYQAAIATVRKGEKDTYTRVLAIINDYCYRVYEIAGIEMDQTDVEYFYPISILREFSKDPKLSDLFDPYRQYILSIEK